MTTATARKLSRAATGILIILFFGIPLVYTLLISVQTPNGFTRDPLALPIPPTGSNFPDAWTEGDLGQQLINTAIYAILAAAITTALCLFIAFPIARKLVRTHRAVYTAMVLGMCLPMPIIPLFIEAQALGLYNNRLGYIALHLEIGIPTGVLLLTAFVSVIPVELDHAAILDGVGYLRYLWRFVLPLAFPSVVIVFLYSLLNVWNDIIGPIVFLADQNLYPVTRGVYQFFGSSSAAWTVLSAAIVIVSLPVMALFIVSQRQLLKSTVGASL